MYLDLLAGNPTPRNPNVTIEFERYSQGKDVPNPAVDRDNYIGITSKKTRAGHVMDFLGFDKMCCRRHMLTQVDMI